MVRVTDVKYGELQLQGCLKVDEHTFNEFSRRYTPKQGDIIITRVGTYGITARVINTVFCLGQNTAAIIPHSINARYLYAALNSAQLRYQIDGSAVGSTQKTLSLKCINALQIPRLGELQEAEVAELIGSLDDRITLLRETNATLEAIAQALFKSWFVDFDPVRAKMEGRAPEGMDEATAALFPSTFSDTPQGPVPGGWSMEPLSDVMDFKEGPGIRNWQYTNSDEGTRFINIRCIQDGDLTIETANRISNEEANGKYAHFHLAPWDVVVSTSGTLGRSAIVREEHLPLMLNTSVIRFRPVTGRTVFSFLYQYLNGGEFLYKLESMASGSVQKNFGPMHLKQIQLICPTFPVLEAYEDLCRPLYEKIIANRTQAQTLATLRDTLLPRLISGQLRLPELSEHISA